VPLVQQYSGHRVRLVDNQNGDGIIALRSPFS